MSVDGRHLCSLTTAARKRAGLKENIGTKVGSCVETYVVREQRMDRSLGCECMGACGLGGVSRWFMFLNMHFISVILKEFSRVGNDIFRDFAGHFYWRKSK